MPCSQAKVVDINNTICKCGLDDSCWSQQSVLRFGFALMALFSLLLVLSVFGCGAAAERSKFVGKFLIIPCLAAALFVVPNPDFEDLSGAVKFLSPIFLIAQATVLIDFAYTWNETWHRNALDPMSRKITATGKEWYVAIVVSALALIVSAVAGAFYSMALYESLLARVLIASAVLCSIALLVLSITEWCEHGTLLTSAVMMAYFVWLATKTAASLSEDRTAIPSTSDVETPWLGIALGLFVLAVSTSKTHPDTFHMTSSEFAKDTYRRLEADPEVQATGVNVAAAVAAGVTASDAARRQASPGFTGHCVFNMTAASYWVMLLTSPRDWACFVVWGTALVLSMLLYFWTLIAPKVFPNRTFG